MIRRWVAFWDQREPPTSLALVRIFVGATVLSDLLIAWHLGTAPDLWVPGPLGMGYGAEGSSPPWSVRWFGATPDGLFAIFLWNVLSALFLMVGAFTRIASWSLAFASAQLSIISPSADRGIDDLLRIVAAVIGLSGAGARWSIDAWLRRARKLAPIDRVPAWPRYLLFLQVLWVYFSAAQHRGDEDWWPSGGLSALGKILSDPHFTRVPPGWLEPLYPLTQLGTIGTMVFELSAPLLLLWTWYERTPRWPGALRRAAVLLRVRWIWLATGISFHLGIALTMRLGIFPFGMLALYPALLHPREIEVGARRALAALPLRRRATMLPRGIVES